MQPKRYLRLCVMAMLAVTGTAGLAQERLCSELPPIEREFARAFGACRDLAPIIDVAPIIIPVPNVVGLTFDDARSRLAGFDVRRSYRASGEPGGTVLAQEPAPQARVTTGSPITVVVSDGSLRQRPLVGESEIDGVKRPLEAPAQPRVVPRRPVPAPQQARTAPVQRGAATSVAQPAQVTAAQRGSAAQSETVEVPNVVGRSGADASRLLADFKVDRIEVVANAAPSGQVLAQDPAPGTARGARKHDRIANVRRVARQSSSDGTRGFFSTFARNAAGTDVDRCVQAVGTKSSIRHYVHEQRRADTNRRRADRPCARRIVDAPPGFGRRTGGRCGRRRADRRCAGCSCTGRNSVSCSGRNCPGRNCAGRRCAA